MLGFGNTSWFEKSSSPSSMIERKTNHKNPQTPKSNSDHDSDGNSGFRTRLNEENVWGTFISRWGLDRTKRASQKTTKAGILMMTQLGICDDFDEEKKNC
ncbi:hypothetical protein MRB53_007834 [Persea americana]|uniref:Uncharacterized protein n=1 Tax=Persea americana TaxID=3435 RepID=A0ACC2ML06_PERAE|nr:hypothetical protein MRB53_007834 [Persea americana]